MPPALQADVIKLLRAGSDLGIRNQLVLNQIVGLGLPLASAWLRKQHQQGHSIPSRQPPGPYRGPDGSVHKRLAQIVQDIEDELITQAQQLAGEYSTRVSLVLCQAVRLGLRPAVGWVKRNGYNQRTLARANRETARYRYSRNPQKNTAW